MSHNDWKEKAKHITHVALQTDTGKKAVKAAATTLAAVAPAAVVAAGAAASVIALPAAAITALGYGIYRLLK